MPKLEDDTTRIIPRPLDAGGRNDLENNADHRAGYRLPAELIDLSEDKEWSGAKEEWSLLYVYRTAADNPGRCLCGKTILEHCVLVNRLNGNEVTVGNHCVKQFLDLPSEAIFAGFRRITANPEAALTLRVLEQLYSQEYLTEWEYRFLTDIARLRKNGWRLFPRQRAKLVEVNGRLLARVATRRREVADASA